MRWTIFSSQYSWSLNETATDSGSSSADHLAHEQNLIQGLYHTMMGHSREVLYFVRRIWEMIIVICDRIRHKKVKKAWKMNSGLDWLDCCSCGSPANWETKSRAKSEVKTFVTNCVWSDSYLRTISDEVFHNGKIQLKQSQNEIKTSKSEFRWFLQNPL